MKTLNDLIAELIAALDRNTAALTGAAPTTAPAAPVPAAPEPSIVDRARAYAAEHGRDALLALLKQHGVSKVTDLPPGAL